MLYFEPVRHARLHWPDWTFHMGHLDDCETHVIYPKSQTAYINPTGISPLYAIGHVFGHLELAHHLTGGETLTAEQCTEADLWARMNVCTKQAAQWPRWNLAPVG